MLSLSGLSASLPVPFVPFFSASGYWAFCFFLSVLPVLRLTVASSRAASPLSLPGFPRSSRPGFPCLLSRFPYSAFCLFPFVLPGFASRSCSTGAYLLLALSVSVLLFPLSFVRFFSGSDYSASALSFPFFPVSPGSGSLRCLFILVPFRLVTHASLSDSVLSSLFFLSPVCTRLAGGFSYKHRPILADISRFPLVITLGSGYLAG